MSAASLEVSILIFLQTVHVLLLSSLNKDMHAVMILLSASIPKLLVLTKYKPWYFCA